MQKLCMNKRIRITLIIISVILLLISFVMLIVGRINTEYIEYWVSRKVYLIVSGILTSISNLYSGSLGEILIFFHVLLILYLILQSLFSIKAKQREKFLDLISIILFILCWNFFLFQIGFGVNNYRQPIEALFELDNEMITESDLAKTYEYLIKKTNEARYQTELDNNSLTIDSVLSDAYLGYFELAKKYSFISPAKVRVKPLRLSGVFSSSGYTGIYLYFIGEPNVNEQAPLFTLGFVASHEIGHQKGFASENDANFVGFLASIEHPDPNFVYSGYEAMMTYVGNSLYDTDPALYKELSQRISKDVLTDMKVEQQFWNAHVVKKNEEIHNAINDSFLKANNQPEGLASYSRVTELAVKAYKKGLF